MKSCNKKLRSYQPEVWLKVSTNLKKSQCLKTDMWMENFEESSLAEGGKENKFNYQKWKNF
jgi:hypothetical protein